MRNRVIAAVLLALFGYGFLATGEAAGIVIGLAMLAGAALNVYRIVRPPSPAISLSPPANPTSTSPTVVMSTAGKSRRGQSGLTRLAVLEPNQRAEIANDLGIDESVEFVIKSQGGRALVGTDARLLIAMGSNWRSGNSWASTPYTQIGDVRVDTRRRGSELKIVTGQTEHGFPLEGQVDLGLQVLQEIRQKVRDAWEAVPVSSQPESESAFTETSHRPIPPPARGARSLTLGDMLAMTPTEFEELTGRALEAMGYTEMKVQGGSGDLSADLTGFDPQGRSVIVQCKRYAPGNNVGSPSLQQFIGMMAVHHKADRGIYVTTSDYSQQAVALAQEHGIVLIDGDDLVKIAGLALAELAPAKGSPAKYCSECGKSLEPSMRFCGACGHPAA